MLLCEQCRPCPKCYLLLLGNVLVKFWENSLEVSMIKISSEEDEAVWVCCLLFTDSLIQRFYRCCYWWGGCKPRLAEAQLFPWADRRDGT